MIWEILEILCQSAVAMLCCGIVAVLFCGITVYLLLSGIAKVIRSITLARRIEQNILNQIEDMVKAKMERDAK